MTHPFSLRGRGARFLLQCGPYLKPIVITALHTGFRKSELLSLTGGDVDFQHRLIKVTAVYAKNGEARSMPMTEVLTETLNAIRITGNPTGAIFRTGEEEPCRDISTAVRRAEISDFTFHDLRHTCVSRLVMAGIDLATVKESMGHKHINMTLRYAHLAPGHKRSAIAVLDQVEEKVATISATVSKQVSDILV
jgi:integrase